MHQNCKIAQIHAVGIPVLSAVCDRENEISVFAPADCRARMPAFAERVARAVTDVVQLTVFQQPSPAADRLPQVAVYALQYGKIARDVLSRFCNAEKAAARFAQPVIHMRKGLSVFDEHALGIIVIVHAEKAAVAGKQYILSRILQQLRRIEHGGDHGAALLIIGMGGGFEFPTCARLRDENIRRYDVSLSVRHADLFVLHARNDLFRLLHRLRLQTGIQIFPTFERFASLFREGNDLLARIEIMRYKTVDRFG